MIQSRRAEEAVFLAGAFYARRKLRDESKIPFVHNFFTRSAPGMSAHKGYSSIALTPLAWTSAGRGRLPMLEACSPTFGPSSWATQQRVRRTYCSINPKIHPRRWSSGWNNL